MPNNLDNKIIYDSAKFIQEVSHLIAKNQLEKAINIIGTKMPQSIKLLAEFTVLKQILEKIYEKTDSGLAESLATIADLGALTESNALEKESSTLQAKIILVAHAIQVELIATIIADINKNHRNLHCKSLLNHLATLIVKYAEQQRIAAQAKKEHDIKDTVALGKQYLYLYAIAKQLESDAKQNNSSYYMAAGLLVAFVALAVQKQARQDLKEVIEDQIMQNNAKFFELLGILLEKSTQENLLPKPMVHHFAETKSNHAKTFDNMPNKQKNCHNKQKISHAFTRSKYGR